MQGKPYRVVQTAKGLDVPWGAEMGTRKGAVLCGQREPEGPFGEFPGYYSGCHRYPVIEIDRVSHGKDPIYDFVYVGRPWTELDYLQAMTSVYPNIRPVECRVSRGRRGQRALHARLGSHRFHQNPVWRICQVDRPECPVQHRTAWATPRSSLWLTPMSIRST